MLAGTARLCTTCLVEGEVEVGVPGTTTLCRTTLPTSQAGTMVSSLFLHDNITRGFELLIT